MADIRDLAKRDIEDITSNPAGWGDKLIFSNPQGQTITVYGLFTQHHLGFDPEAGVDIVTKNAHCSVSEKFFIDEGYQVRNSNGEVDMDKHYVIATLSTGVAYKFVLHQFFADETIGLIMMILGDFEQV